MIISIEDRSAPLKRSSRWSGLWIYDELYSCPTPVLMGKTSVANNPGFIVLPLANYRVNFLRRGESWIAFHNIPLEMKPSEIFRVCSMIVRGGISDADPLDKVLAYSIIYGGLSLFLKYDNQILLLNMEPVNTDVFHFYIRSSRNTELKDAGLEYWSAFMLSIREGLTQLMHESCKAIGRLEGNSCVISTSRGELFVSTENIMDETLLKVVPENTPLRHVVKI
ncbi:MAG: hypothetical protein QXY95_04710 [Thermosphaera sp.]